MITNVAGNRTINLHHESQPEIGDDGSVPVIGFNFQIGRGGRDVGTGAVCASDECRADHLAGHKPGVRLPDGSEAGRVGGAAYF